MEQSPVQKMTPLEAATALRDYDHCFISEEGCKAFHAAMGQEEYGGQVWKANPRDPKGLTLKDGAAEARGMDAADLGSRLCSLLGCQQPVATGRGFRLRQACDSLEAYWRSETGQLHAARIATDGIAEDAGKILGV